MPKRRVYVLAGKPEEDIAMAMAVTSRSPLPFDQILAKTDSTKSGKFLEKFYITYGHGSIADTAFIHLAVENISQLAIKVMENTRLAAYQEKSTRYQKIDRDHIVEPKEIRKSKHHKLYQETINKLFDLYEKMSEVLMAQAKKKNPRKPGEKETDYSNRIRIPVFDQCRLLLPAAVMGNVGVTMSGRSIEYTIAKLLSNPLSEARELGTDIKKATIKQLPILVKHADPINYAKNLEKNIYQTAQKILGKQARPPQGKGVRLVKYDRDALERILTASLERFSHFSYSEIQRKIKTLSQRERQKLFDKIIGKRGKRHDKPLRELETTNYTFDFLVDFGAYRDLQRHRMLTQTAQILDTSLGYVEPIDLKNSGLREEYLELMEAVNKNYREIAKDMLYEAQYLVPMAYKRRVLFHMNLREAFYLIELRSGPRGHISYRRIAYQMWQEINRVHPYFAKHIKVDTTGLI